MSFKKEEDVAFEFFKKVAFSLHENTINLVSFLARNDLYILLHHLSKLYKFPHTKYMPKSPEPSLHPNHSNLLNHSNHTRRRNIKVQQRRHKSIIHSLMAPSKVIRRPPSLCIRSLLKREENFFRAPRSLLSQSQLRTHAIVHALQDLAARVQIARFIAVAVCLYARDVGGGWDCDIKVVEAGSRAACVPVFNVPCPVAGDCGFVESLAGEDWVRQSKRRKESEKSCGGEHIEGFELCGWTMRIRYGV